MVQSTSSRKKVVITYLVNGIATVFSVEKLLQDLQICNILLTWYPPPF